MDEEQLDLFDGIEFRKKDQEVEILHEWYGPCDTFGPSGECVECHKKYFDNEHDWLLWMQS